MEIKDFISQYSSDFKSLLDKIEVSDAKGNKLSFADGIAQAVAVVKEVTPNHKKIMFVGNGGSASIASHQSIDYWKNGGMRSMAFNDPSQLTCLANDLGYPEVFAKPISVYADKDDVVFCISSSGGSVNILNAAKTATGMGCKVLTFSGFKSDNPLRSLGDLNFFLPSFSYGYVEIIHLFIIHSILDAKLYCMDKVDVFNKNTLLK